MAFQDKHGQFVVEKFLDKPGKSAQDVEKLKKAELVDVGEALKLGTVTGTKKEMVTKIKEELGLQSPELDSS